MIQYCSVFKHAVWCVFVCVCVRACMHACVCKNLDKGITSYHEHLPVNIPPSCVFTPLCALTAVLHCKVVSE